MALRTKFCSEPTVSFSVPDTLNQVKLSAAGLATLLQVRVTELPSGTGSEGSTDTEVFLGESVKESALGLDSCQVFRLQRLKIE